VSFDFVPLKMSEPRQEYYIKPSDLFDNWIYLEDICDALCIALVELPSMLELCNVRVPAFVNELCVYTF